VGNLDPNRNVEVLVDAMDQVSGAVLAILGDGVQSDTVARHRSALAQPQRVQLLGRCAQEEVVARLSRHDVGIIAYIPNDAQLDEALPNKLFDYLAAGLAVAACPASALKHFKPAQGALRFMRVDTVAHLAADLATLVADRAWITSAKEAAVASGATLTWEVEQDRLVALLEGLM